MQKNVQDLIRFVKNARQNGMADDDIVKAAEAFGSWNHETIQAVVLTTDSNTADMPTDENTAPDNIEPVTEHIEEVPEDTPAPVNASEETKVQLEAKTPLSNTSPPYPDNPPQGSTMPNLSNAKDDEDSLPILQAVIHHVSLWAFLLCSIPAIIYLIRFLSNDSSSYRDDLNTLTTFASVTFVTGGLYAIMYTLYLRRRIKHNPRLKTRRVLAILTITGSTIGALISGSVLIYSLLNVWWQGDPMSTVWSSLVVTFLFLVTIATYLATDSLKGNHTPFRSNVIRFVPLINLAIIIGLFIAAFMSAPTLAKDARMQNNLVEVTEKIVEFTKEREFLPHATDFEESMNYEGISYNQLTDNTYELCGTFERDTTDNSSRHESVISDDYVNEWNFSRHTAGEHCFELQNNYVNNPRIPRPEPMPEPMPMPSIDPVIPRIQ